MANNLVTTAAAAATHGSTAPVVVGGAVAVPRERGRWQRQQPPRHGRGDARLLALRALLQRAEAEAVFLSDSAEEAAPEAVRSDLERAAELAWTFAAELRERILRVPAEGPAGLAVKLELAAQDVSADAAAPDERAVLAALADARRLAGL